MSFEYRFHPLAEQELEATVEYLESQRKGSGLELAAAVENATATLLLAGPRLKFLDAEVGRIW